MLMLSAQRVPSESTIISVSLTDDIKLNLDTRYRFIAMRKDPLETVETKALVGPFSGNTTDYTYIKSEYGVCFRILFNLHIFGGTFLIQAERYDNGANTYTSEMIQVTTLPAAPILHELDNQAMIYDDSGIPKSIKLSWEPSWRSSDNANVIGYSIYFSLTKRNTVSWGPWQSALPSTDGNRIILQPTQTEYSMDCSFLTGDNPYDVRFMVVTVDNTEKQQESRPSNMVKYELSDCITAIIGHKATDLEYYFNNDFTRPLSIRLGTERFVEEQVHFMLRRMRYEPPFPNYGEVYGYEVKATGTLSRFLSITIHIELAFNTKFEVRVLRNNKWVQIPATYNRFTKNVSFLLHEITSFALLIPDTSLSKYNALINSAEKKFSHFTNLMLMKFPVWSKLRRNPVNATGAAFLNIFGLEFDDMEFILDYAIKQQYIQSIDTYALDWVTKFKPDVTLTSSMIVKVFTDDGILQETTTLTDFLTYDDHGSYRPKVLYDNPFIVDYDEQVIYIRNKFERVKLEVWKDVYSDSVLHEGLYYPEWHHIWGFLDEFGMLFDLRRLPMEPNLKFKERILDVFTNPSNASKEGLMNGIARELGIRHNATWDKPSQPFIIEDPMVIINYIKVNGVVVDKTLISFNEKGNVVLTPALTADGYSPYTTDESGEYHITYVSGMEMHTFFKDNDYAFRHQLYDVDGMATRLFRQYVDRIKNEIPIEWGWFTWNQAYWDISDTEMSGYGHLPTAIDAHIEGFRNYRI